MANEKAKIDEVLGALGNAQKLPTVTFTEKEIGETEGKTVDVLVRQRIRVLLERKTLTALDISLLDVLLKNGNEFF